MVKYLQKPLLSDELLKMASSFSVALNSTMSLDLYSYSSVKRKKSVSFVTCFFLTSHLYQMYSVNKKKHFSLKT